ncbi:MAG: DUF72 domain-containing protein [Infirmifilum uzonense]|jgi:uncharacterized protein YecE (DUF72 family)|nr:DUF72 domain-containing protein [Infirmifilum uzonense]
MKMKLFVGTSGWVYDWNPDGIEWYVRESGFNAIELNMSFYSFPREENVEEWSKKAHELRWSVKVHRSITHIRKLNEKALPTWKRFLERFKDLEESIDFYLFQLPPSLTFNEKVVKRIELFSATCEKIAIEPRHLSWFTMEALNILKDKGVYVVTPDSPLFEGLPSMGVINIKGIVYVRMHGRLTWYNYGYMDEELYEVADRIVEAKPVKAYVFFNNNHDMLGDGRRLIEIFQEKYGTGLA